MELWFCVVRCKIPCSVSKHNPCAAVISISKGDMQGML